MKSSERAASIEEQEGGRVLRLSGPWTTHTVGQISGALEKAAANAERFDLTDVNPLDSNGATLISMALARASAGGTSVAVEGLGPNRQQLLDTIREAGEAGKKKPVKGRRGPVAFVEHIGEATVGLGSELKLLLNFLGETVLGVGKMLLRPWRIRIRALVTQMQETGLAALPIVGLLAFLIGVVTAFQGSDQLARFGAQIYTVNIVGLGVLREMGVLITAIIVAGRSGSAFAAQIGTMKVNQEIDALETLGLDSMEVLILPRVMGLVLVMPLLVFYANALAIFGGAVMASFTLDISFSQFAIVFEKAVPLNALWVGMVKAPIFAFIIALVGCFQGMMVARDAASVGQRTTRAVVQGVFMVIVLDALLSVFFSLVGI